MTALMHLFHVVGYSSSFENQSFCVLGMLGIYREGVHEISESAAQLGVICRHDVRKKGF
jgi:hypothetical protein